MSLGKSLLNHSDVEVYFIVDEEWQGKLAKLDERFKFAVIEYDNSDQKNRIVDMLTKFETFLKLPLLDRSINMWTMVMDDKKALEMDVKCGNFGGSSLLISALFAV